MCMACISPQRKIDTHYPQNSQDYVQRKFNTGPNPVNFVFHGGSGSTRDEIREAISYGAIKMNIDTDMQWAYWEGIKNYYEAKSLFTRSDWQPGRRR